MESTIGFKVKQSDLKLTQDTSGPVPCKAEGDFQDQRGQKRSQGYGCHAIGEACHGAHRRRLSIRRSGFSMRRQAAHFAAKIAACSGSDDLQGLQHRRLRVGCLCAGPDFGRSMLEMVAESSRSDHGLHIEFGFVFTAEKNFKVRSFLIEAHDSGGCVWGHQRVGGAGADLGL